MREADSGLLGTRAPAPGGPDGRPPLEVVETGHVGLDQRTRRGDLVRAWYRGPLLPHPADLDRAAAAAGPHRRPAAGGHPRRPRGPLAGRRVRDRPAAGPEPAVDGGLAAAVAPAGLPGRPAGRCSGTASSTASTSEASTAAARAGARRARSGAACATRSRSDPARHHRAAARAGRPRRPDGARRRAGLRLVAGDSASTSRPTQPPARAARPRCRPTERAPECRWPT